MASLLNKAVGNTYKDLLTVLGDTSGQGLEPTAKRVFDGEGTGSPLYLGTNSLTVAGSTTINGATNIVGVTSITGNTTVTGNLSVDGNLSYTGTISGAGLTGSNITGQTITGDIISTDSYRFKNSGSQVIAFTYNGTKSAIVVEQNLRTKGSMTFTAAGHDDLIVSASSGTFEKGDGTKGKVSLGDTKVSLKKGDTELLSVEEDGTLRMQSVSSEPSSPSSGDMVNIDGEIYIST